MRIPDSFKKFLIFFLVNLVVHLPFLHLPPCGQHVWRQCNTLAMSRNFAEGNMNILEPRIDRSNETDGLTGSHFPLYEWGFAAISRLTGFSEAAARIYSLLIFTFGMLFFYKALRKLNVPAFSSTCGALLLLSVPQMYYDSINAMPDILALCLALGSLYFFLGYFKDNKSGSLVAAILMAMTAGLVKFQFLIIPFSSIAFLQSNKKNILVSILSAIVVVVPVVTWYRYALSLTKLNNLREFGLWIQPIGTEKKLQTFFNNLVSDLPEILTGWPLFAGLVVSLLIFLRSFSMRRENIFILLWLAGFACFYIMAIERMMHHSYYFMALIPLFVIVLLRCLKTFPKVKPVLIALLVCNFIWAFVRIIPDRWYNLSGIPPEFADKNMRKALQDCIPKDAKSVVGPDVSGCIFFYFLDTEGYSFEDPAELLRMTRDGRYFDVMKQNGVRHLVFRREAGFPPAFDQLEGLRLLKRVGNFYVYGLD